MKHASAIVTCEGPESPHAFDIIPETTRPATLDAPCPTCKGHGQWNTEIDLVSFRSKRAICSHCVGWGWIETGSDGIPSHDVVMTPEGYPKWIIRYNLTPK